MQIFCLISYIQCNVLRFIHVVICLNILFLFNTLQYSVVCLYYLHCFQFLAFMNNAIIIICMNFSRGYIFLFLSKEYLWMELLEKVSFHSNPNEKQCQRMFKLLHNCVHFACYQGNAQNPSNYDSTVCEPRYSRCTSWIQKWQRKQRLNCQHLLHHKKKQGNSRKTSTSASLIMLKPLTVWVTTNCRKFLKRWEYQTTCLLRNLYADQEATVRTGLETTEWFQLGKEVQQSCILSPCLFT